eukprot:15342459-Ditylum_brightwellii.AAC.2
MEMIQLLLEDDYQGEDLKMFMADLEQNKNYYKATVTKKKNKQLWLSSKIVPILKQTLTKKKKGMVWV